jgi:hypothetical protein
MLWGLGFEASLELGAWILELVHGSLSRPEGTNENSPAF